LPSCKEEIEFNFNPKIDQISFDISDYSLLDSTFNKHNYDLDSIAVNKIVPPVFVSQITPSIKSLKKKVKKANFVRILLSHTLKFNQEIGETRINLFKTLNKPSLERTDSIWLDSLCNVFRVKKQKYSKLIDKVDVIPPSLIIVQGIIESGWATSKYAIEGNNLFGLYGSRKKKITKNGVSRLRAQKFDSIEECVREYICNLNRHGSYSRMRKERSKMHELGVKITGIKLAKTLVKYSTLGERYVRKIVSMINYYKLEQFDDYTLGSGVSVIINVSE
jgi:Bax protein